MRLTLSVVLLSVLLLGATGLAAADTIDNQELEIRNESGDNDLIDDNSIDISVTFSTDGELFTREPTDGRVDLSGLPAGEEIVVSVESDAHFDRRLIVDDLAELETMYLLSGAEDGVANEFRLEDASGDYPPESTKIILERSITDGSTTTREKITGDYFGGSAAFTAILQDNARYRITLINENGQQRQMGPYVATENEGGIRILEVREIVLERPQGDNAIYEARIDDKNLIFLFDDGEEQTTNLNLTIRERGNDSNVLHQDFVEGPLGTHDVTIALDEQQLNTTWVVEFQADRDDDELDVLIPVGQGAGSLGLPLPDPYATFLSVGALVFVAGLFGAMNARTGAIAVVVVAAILWLIGILNTSATWILLAGIIAIGAKVGEYRRL